jgi:Ankyrin repeats (3 copies)
MNDLSTMAVRESRVPRALVAVFLASNRGKEVHKPPAEACRSFRRGFFHRAVKNITDKKESPREKARNGLFFRRKIRRDSIKSQVTEDNCASESFSIEPCTLASSSPSSLKSDRVLQEVAVHIKVDVQANVSPQEHLDSIMKSRGYPTKRYSALETGYRNKPTPLQMASYDLYLISLVRKGDTETFCSIFKSGISSNPCNANGESLLHTVSRRGATEFLRIMLEEAKSTVQVADDYGRCPLHDCLWSAEPCFDKVKLLLDRDVYLMQLADARGSLPLSYTRQEHWGVWNQFLDDIKDSYWPEKSATRKQKPPLAQLKPNSQSVRDPSNALPLHVAAMVAGGKLSPDHFIGSKKDDSDDEDDDSDDYASESSCDSDEDDGSASTFDEEEISNLLALCRTKQK